MPDRNPNPWAVNTSRELQTSSQDVAYLLCAACEQKLSSFGERWTMRYGRQRGGSSKLVELLGHAPIWSNPRTSTVVRDVGSIPAIKIDQLSHFATGVIWRASQHTQGWCSVKLGPYGEAFRRYLNKEAEFPVDAVLNVCIRPESDIAETVRFPTTARLETVHLSSFVMPGLAFNLFVGKLMPLFATKLCIVRSPGNPIVVSRNIEALLKGNMLNVLEEFDKRQGLYSEVR